MRISGRWFSLSILGLAFILGSKVLIYSWQIPQETKEIDSGLEGGDTVPLVEVYELHKDVLVDKNEYALNETIVAKAVIVNDGSSPVRIRPPSVFSATGYSVGSTDERVSQGVSITWAESEIEIPANASTVLCRFSFRGEEPGPFIISISGFPEKEVMIVESDREHSENFWDRDYRIQVPEDSEYRTLRGVLDVTPFPLSKGEASKPISQDFIMEDVLVVETYDSFDEPSGEQLYLFTDGPGTLLPRSSRFYTPDSTGYKLLGGMILTEVYEARVNGLTGEVEGPTFTYQRLGETYNLVKVEEIRIHEAWRLPLLVSHDFELVSGNYHFCFSGKERVEFPCKFPVGYIHHEDEFGNAEHNLHVLLNKGEMIHRVQQHRARPLRPPEIHELHVSWILHPCEHVLLLRRRR